MSSPRVGEEREEEREREGKGERRAREQKRKGPSTLSLSPPNPSTLQKCSKTTPGRRIYGRQAQGIRFNKVPPVNCRQLPRAARDLLGRVCPVRGLNVQSHGREHHAQLGRRQARGGVQVPDPQGPGHRRSQRGEHAGERAALCFSIFFGGLYFLRGRKGKKLTLFPFLTKKIIMIKGSCEAPAGKVWSLFFPRFNYPQEASG